MDIPGYWQHYSLSRDYGLFILSVDRESWYKKKPAPMNKVKDRLLVTKSNGFLESQSEKPMTLKSPKKLRRFFASVMFQSY